ncbi:MAG: WD40 repeat domain-containing protein [Planctomycetota bacterium]
MSGARAGLLWAAALLFAGVAALQTASRARLEAHVAGLVDDGGRLAARAGELDAERAAATDRAEAEAERRARADRDRSAAAASVAAERRRAYNLGFESARLLYRLGEQGELHARLASLPEDLRGFEWTHLTALSERRVRVLAGHERPVLCIDAAAEAPVLVSGGYGGAVRVWTVGGADGGGSVELVGHEDDVLAVALDADGTRVASSSDDGTVRLWSAAGGELARHELDDRPWSVALDAAGDTLAAATDGGHVFVWDSAGEVARLTLDVAVESLAIDADGELLACGDEDGGVHLWRFRSDDDPTVFEPHDEWISSLVLSADGELLIARAGDGAAALLRTSDGERVGELDEDEGDISSVDLSPDGRLIATVSDAGVLRVRDAATLATLRALRIDAPAERVALLADGGVAFAGADERVRLWRDRPEPPRLVIDVGARLVKDVALSADGRLAVSGTADGEVRVHDAVSGALLHTLSAHPVTARAVAFDAGATRVVSGDRQGGLFLWSGADFRERRELPPSVGPVVDVRFLPDDERIAALTEDGGVRLLDAASGEELALLPGPHSGIFAAALGPLGERNVFAAPGGTLRVFSALTGERLAALRSDELGRASRLALSPSEPLLATTATGTETFLWELESGAERARVAPLYGGYVSALAFSPDGARLVLGSSNGVVQVVDAASGFELIRIETGVEGLRTLALSADGARLAAGGARPRIEVWR